MATNPYFQSGLTSGTTSEQRLIEDLIIESLKIYGHDIYYLPRTSVKQDNILGEDILSRFEEAYPIEMYLANVSGWSGDRELFSKFGIEVRDKATFVVAKRRWEESVAQQTENLQLPLRPAEGDLLYFAKTNAMFEIKFVDHLDPFFQLGKFYVYSLQCEMYQYSSEVINTGIDDIDTDFEALSLDTLQHSVLTQSGVALTGANGLPIVLSGHVTTDSWPMSNTEEFQEEAESIIDFSARNPFGEI